MDSLARGCNIYIYIVYLILLRKFFSQALDVFIPITKSGKRFDDIDYR